MLMIIREGSAAGPGSAVGVTAIHEKTAKQVQAYIRKKVEKQRRQNGELSMAEEIENIEVLPKKEDQPGEETGNSDSLGHVVSSAYGPDRELQPVEIEELKAAFDEFDCKKKGYVKCIDLGECMRTMGYMPTEMELIELSQSFGSGKLDFEDFMELMGPKILAETTNMIGMKEMKIAFQMFDSNGDGLINLAELKEAMKKLMGEQFNPKEIDLIVRDVDRNDDKLIDFEEFVQMMTR